MKAILCKSLDGYQSLVMEELGEPERAPGEALIEVKNVALNFFDTLITKGRYQFKPELPFSPGGEFAGVIKEIDENPEGLKAGDRVMAYPAWGALRQQLTISADKLIRLPDDISDEIAASLMITYGTAMHGLIDRANIKAGETVAILGAGGGAGLAAVEIAKAAGAYVVAVASSEERIELAKAHGAAIGLNSTTADLKTELKAIVSDSGRKGVDVVYDCIGDKYAEPALRALNWGGRFLVVGFAAGEIPHIPLNLIMLKGIHVQGVFWGRFIEQQPADFKAHMRQLLAWVQQGAVKPHIQKVFPLSETVAALEHLSARKALGKILIDVAAV